jgi:hypothetical protein
MMGLEPTTFCMARSSAGKAARGDFGRKMPDYQGFFQPVRT